MNQQPDIIHIHEWHTSGVALLYWDMYNALGLTRPRIALTIHNMEHHGECRQEQLDMCGLDGASYLVPDKVSWTPLFSVSWSSLEVVETPTLAQDVV